MSMLINSQKLNSISKFKKKLSLILIDNQTTIEKQKLTIFGNTMLLNDITLESTI